jgi:hypothetical protein
MRLFFAPAIVAIAVGCGAAPPAPVVNPVAVNVSPDVAASAARAIIDARYGIDPNAGTDRVIVGRAEWLDDNAWLANKWEHGVLMTPTSAADETWFRVVAVVENPTPGAVAVRIVGVANTGAERFDGMEPFIQSGDPRMPLWANRRVALMQYVINKRLRQYAVH